MLRVPVVTLILLMTLAGCTGMQTGLMGVKVVPGQEPWPLRATFWQRDGATPEQFEREKSTCFAASGGDLNGDVYYPATYKKCMENRGWKDVHVK